MSLCFPFAQTTSTISSTSPSSSSITVDNKYDENEEDSPISEVSREDFSKGEKKERKLSKFLCVRTERIEGDEVENRARWRPFGRFRMDIPSEIYKMRWERKVNILAQFLRDIIRLKHFDWICAFLIAEYACEEYQKETSLRCEALERIVYKTWQNEKKEKEKENEKGEKQEKNPVNATEQSKKTSKVEKKAELLHPLLLAKQDMTFRSKIDEHRLTSYENFPFELYGTKPCLPVTEEQRVEFFL